MKRCIIIGGSEIKNYELIKSYFRADDYFIYCDCGLKHEKAFGIKADLIIGDFDSHEKPENLENVIVLPVEKDDTDTIFAVKEAIKRGFEEFILVGVTGGRQDHNLGNIYALLMLKDKSAMIVDDYSEIKIIKPNELTKIKYGWKFFSLLNITGTAKGIYIKNAKYNLENAEIKSEFQYGISNEILSPENDAEVYLTEGYLLLICVRKSEILMSPQ